MMDRRIAATEWDFKFRKSSPLRSPTMELEFFFPSFCELLVESLVCTLTRFFWQIQQIHATPLKHFSA